MTKSGILNSATLPVDQMRIRVGPLDPPQGGYISSIEYVDLGTVSSSSYRWTWNLRQDGGYTMTVLGLVQIRKERIVLIYVTFCMVLNHDSDTSIAASSA